MNGLHCRTVDADCPYDLAGVTFPGIPGIVLGHNGRIAWGATNADPDVQDLFVETRRSGRARQLPVRRGVDPVLGPDRDDQGRRRRRTSRSRSARPATGRSSTTSTSGSPRRRCSRSAGRPPPTSTGRSRRSSGSRPRRTSRSSARSFASYGSPSQNFVYADVDGHIGYVLPGRIPIRERRRRPRRPAAVRQRRRPRVVRLHPVRGAALAARPPERLHRHREQRRGRRRLPVLHRVRVGPGLPGGPDHGADRGGRRRAVARRSGSDPERHPDRPRRPRPCSTSAGSTRRRRTATRSSSRSGPGTASPRPTGSARPRTAPSSTGCCAACSTTSWATWPASTSAAGHRGRR